MTGEIRNAVEYLVLMGIVKKSELVFESDTEPEEWHQ